MCVGIAKASEFRGFTDFVCRRSKGFKFRGFTDSLYLGIAKVSTYSPICNQLGMEMGWTHRPNDSRWTHRLRLIALCKSMTVLEP